MATPENSSEVWKFGEEEIEVIFRKSTPTEEATKRFAALWFPPPNPGVIVEDGIRCERDVPVKMRDGVPILIDIYRPEGGTNLPAIVAWGPYGKQGGYAPGGTIIPKGKYPLGVPENTFSKMARFEGPDPTYWCRYGYAVINVDSRGSGYSEGNVMFWGTREALDAYDLIEWVAAREWCNGRVTMQGTSWLAMTQWFTAALQPPHLACIAPWEGASDIYREFVVRGGILEVPLTEFVANLVAGNRYQEDIVAMARKYPLINGYWEDKIAKFENIKIPAYILAGYFNPFHPRGTFEGFERIPNPNKWLRVNNTFEWIEQYDPNGMEDLRRFFDRYLKGIHNGWEYTPRVRVTVLDPGRVDITNRPEDDWPLPRTQYQKFYLDAATKTLSPTPVERESSLRYDASEGNAIFTIKFNKETELTGHAKLRLWVEAVGSKDIDLFVRIGKLDEQGNDLHPLVFGCTDPGFPGYLRVSHRELDKVRSTPQQPYHTHRREQPLKPKEIVPVEIEIWPMGMLWHPGQQLRVYIGGHDMMAPAAQKALSPPGVPPVWGFETRNKGTHVIHTGGKYDSHILVPVIPPK